MLLDFWVRSRKDFAELVFNIVKEANVFKFLLIN